MVEFWISGLILHILTLQLDEKLSTAFWYDGQYFCFKKMEIFILDFLCSIHLNLGLPAGTYVRGKKKKMPWRRFKPATS